MKTRKRRTRLAITNSENSGHLELDLTLDEGVHLHVFEHISGRKPDSVIKRLKALVIRLEKRYQKIQIS